MTEKRTTPNAAAGSRRRKRAAPTIDLKATEVQPTQTAGDPPPDPLVQEPSAQEASSQASSEQARAAPEPSQAEPDIASATIADKSAGDSRGYPGFNITGPVLAAGVAGAATMSLILFGFWLAGLLPIRDAGSADLRARVTGLEMQLRDLQKRPAPAADTQTVDALTQRVAKMEASIAKIPAGDPALADRIAATENAMKALGVSLAALNRRGDSIAAGAANASERAEAAEKAVADLRASVRDVSKTVSASISSTELEALQKRVAALDQAAKLARGDIAKATASDKSARLAVSALALRDAVLRGAPFADELAQVKSLGAEDKILAPLAPFATTGVPSEKALAHELGALLPGMLKAIGASAPSGSFIERLQANAEHLVRIRPLDAPPGDDTSAVLARIEIAAAHGDIVAALTDLGKLSDAQRAPALAWIAKIKNRQAALAAAHQSAVDAVRTLASW
jgi:hypothetical protein